MMEEKCKHCKFYKMGVFDLVWFGVVDKGESYGSVARRLGINRTTVMRICRRHGIRSKHTFGKKRGFLKRLLGMG